LRIGVDVAGIHDREDRGKNRLQVESMVVVMKWDHTDHLMVAEGGEEEVLGEEGHE
jgi:hypothetical protein